MKLQKLYSYARRAIDDYNMISEGDKIAIGISGGKDSLALLYALAGLKHFYPNHFDLIAVTGSAQRNQQDAEGKEDFLHIRKRILP